MPTHLTTDDERLADAIRGFGCPRDAFVSLRNDQKKSPSHVPYLDLLSDQVQAEAKRLPDAVAEFQGKPVMYLLDSEAGEPEPQDRVELQQRLANRGDHAFLAVVRPGELVLYPLNLDREMLNEKGVGKTFRIADPRAPFLFHEIASGTLTEVEGQATEADPVFEEIKKLLDKAVDELVIAGGLDGLDVLSITGRALFFRFLIDREIVTPDLIEKICPVAVDDSSEHSLRRVFSSAERAAQTSAWLDVTFNGDLLPLIDSMPLDAPIEDRVQSYFKIYRKAGEETGDEVFNHLEAILRGWENIENAVEPLLKGIDWHELNFRHIPIGVLSQVYENFSHRVNKQDSTDRSVHYTPRNLANLLVQEALAGLETPAHQAKVLDPACGAGVFLVLTLRELVQRRWMADRERLGSKALRPSKRVIESILHNQIRGFDVSESALRLAALGLYITVIELNEITKPPSAHHASRALQGLVLFDQRTAEEKTMEGFVLGSLGEAVDRDEFDSKFDVVVGNPPWSVVNDPERKKALNETGEAIARRVLSERGLDELAKNYHNPGNVPDVPFLWRAAEWAKPGGIVGLALDARFILKQTDTGVAARNAWFKAAQVTGILNGSDLEKTPVWGCHDQPWILLWNRNRKPDLKTQGFNLATPIREDEFAKRGEFRLDYLSAYQVTAQSVIDKPWLCKALTIGSTLDVQVMDKLCRLANNQSVECFWDVGNKLGQTGSGRGIDLRPWRKEPAPEWLRDLPIADDLLASRDAPELAIVKVPTFLEKFGDKHPYRPYRLENFRVPLVLLERGPGKDRTTMKSHRILSTDHCYTKNFFGYSGGTHSQGYISVALLHIIAHSQLFQHFSYMRSAQMGARKRIIDKSDIDAFPFPDPETLTDEQRSEVLQLADMLDSSGENDWESLDAFVGSLFGLTKAEQQVVSDTVMLNGPYAVVRKRSMLPVPQDEAEAFVKTFERAVQPFFKAVGQKAKATLVPRLEGDWRQPWAFVTLLLEGDTWEPSKTLISSLVAEASASSASRVVMPLPEGGLILGVLNKRRFWTRSRARLCAMHIAEEHLERCFPLPDRG